jgi:hypothetical protein
MSRNGRASGGDLDDREPRRFSKAERIRDSARHLAQMHGGEWADFVEEAERVEPSTPEPYFDDDLTQAGFVLTNCFPYKDPERKLLYESVRYQHRTVPGAKEFRQRRPGSGNVFWLAGAGLIKVPYRWPDLIAKPEEPVHFTEGEKDADRLATLGLLATTVAGQNWSEIAADALSGRDVCIYEDNDEKGRANVQKSVEALEGRAKSIRVIKLPGLKYKQDVSDWLDAGHSKEELLAFVEQARPTGASPAPYQFPDEAEIALWKWLYGRILLRGNVTITAATGGTGKSTKAIPEALSMTSGKPILGEMVPFPMRVLLINLEDDRNTMEKRIAAAMRLHGLTKAEVGDRLFVIAKGERKLKVARLNNGAIKLSDRTIAWLTSYATERKIDVISIDPLIKTHGLKENDNEQMSALVEVFEDIADSANCAISLWHHNRKANGSEPSKDSARGASAIVDACRKARMLEKMTKAEADKLGLPKEQAGFFLKEYDGKLNFSPPIDKVKWFELHNIEIKNAGRGLLGDEVGAISSWTPTQVRGSLTEDQFAQIKRGLSEHSYREDVRAEMWVGKLIGRIFGITDKDKQKAKVKQLTEMGALRSVPRTDGQRRERMFIEVGDIIIPMDLAPEEEPM